MKNIFSPLVYLILPLFCANFARAERLLSMGEQITLPIRAGIKFSVGNPQVISVRNTHVGAKNLTLLVKAKGIGYSDLLILTPEGEKQNHSFRVVSRRQGAVVNDLRSTLKKLPGISILPQGDAYLVLGKVSTVHDWQLLQNFVHQGAGKVVDRSTVDAFIQALALQDLRRKLDSVKLDQVRVGVAGNQLWMEGSVSSQRQKELAEALGRQVLASTRSYLRVPFENKEILRFRVQILELIEGSSQNVGIRWSEHIPGFLEIRNKFSKGTFSLDAGLDLLEKKGALRVLSKPEISLNSEGSAELKVGGEIPIHLRSSHFSGVQWKPYGLTLKLDTPGVVGDLARTNVTMEISTLDHANSHEGVPATKNNRMQTTIDLTLGKTLFLSGLMQNSGGQYTKQIPLLGNIPVLGALFQSRDFQNQRSELAIAITATKDHTHESSTDGL